MTGPYGPDLVASGDFPINHDAPLPGTGFFRDELESMLGYHTGCVSCPFKSVLMELLDVMNRQDTDFARVPPRLGDSE
ncbi:hypothetical protein IU453_16120 [Nocardia cyriacigeorgica]|uniref:hypothetical protein n=1 Tax=Nocardia cyriacigeorgica TaxID=135487 RepID=UPI00189552F3|nr:hypothetical protein [Nocardia cyriacigeorgica]MBF6157489.1 hypothetical protein [Nocardia cyriacigeorgica]MBF6196460.1 hypothetical protein [Nocardia cyriacigeorgica]MBF6318288.1 hypothetical protein [Nocardia cyriacigeorgica]MBF6534044.1 hypothetical protein [Nocardia cyriacigeorgica]